MSEEEHLFYFSSRYTVQDKVTGSFTVRLPYKLSLEVVWNCAVLDFFINSDKSDNQSVQYIYILGDFCKTSFIRDKQLPILQRIPVSESVQQYTPSHLLYIPLKQDSITDLGLTFLNSVLEPVRLSNSTIIECTLHFIKDV
jgi:hypothetical protein